MTIKAFEQALAEAAVYAEKMLYLDYLKKVNTAKNRIFLPEAQVLCIKNMRVTFTVNMSNKYIREVRS